MLGLRSEFSQIAAYRVATTTKLEIKKSLTMKFKSLKPEINLTKVCQTNEQKTKEHCWEK